MIPWRPSPGRVAAYDHVIRFYRAHLPDSRIVEADSGHQLFHRAASRNVGVADAGDVDVIVVGDADTITEPAALHTAVATARDGRLHYAYDRFAYLDEQQTADVLAYRPVVLSDGRRHNSSLMVLTPDAWRAAGGQDERFDGWGGEDDAFYAAVCTLLGPPVWHPGLAVSLWHPSERDVGSTRWQPNSDLARRYVTANGDTAAVRALIAERS